MSAEIIASVFREYDIRGRAGEELTPKFASLLGQAYADFLREKSAPATSLPHLQSRPQVSVGRDCRLSSPELAQALIDGLAHAEIDVIDLGICPTPLTYFSVVTRRLAGGIMVTGSHNPAPDNGFKISVGEQTLHGADLQHLRALMEERLGSPRPAAPTPGQVRPVEIIPSYIKEISGQFVGLRRLKVVLDAGNGTASTVAPELFRALGAKVVPLYCELDGRFPNHHPDPTVPANLRDLVERVRTEKADLGLAFDGDADRLGVVDESGRMIFGDELLILLARGVLAARPGATIISEVKSSLRLYRDIRARGGQALMWKTGHSLIKAKMKETGALLAGEMSGHIFFADRYHGYDDALYAGARLYEILAQSTLRLSQMLLDLEPMVATPEIRLECPDALKFTLMQRVVEKLSQQLPGPASPQVILLDGVRLEYPGGWGLLRASNTQPVLVARFEAQDQLTMNHIQQVFLEALNPAARSLGLDDFALILAS